MDIGSGKGYPQSALSNFVPRVFMFDGVRCNSLEGVLQSFKFESTGMQEYICTLVGRTAKLSGKKKAWYRTQTLYWKGEIIDRHSDRYQELITSLYDAVFDQCESFRKALIAIHRAVLTHSIGKSDPHRTILTEREFVGQLNRLRAKLR